MMVGASPSNVSCFNTNHTVDPVSSAVWHPSGAVLATCSGRRLTRQQMLHLSSDTSPSSSDDDDDDDGDDDDLEELDNVLKISTF